MMTKEELDGLVVAALDSLSKVCEACLGIQKQFTEESSEAGTGHGLALAAGMLHVEQKLRENVVSLSQQARALGYRMSEMEKAKA